MFTNETLSDWTEPQASLPELEILFDCKVNMAAFFAGEVRVFHSPKTFSSVYDRDDCSNMSMLNKNLLCRPSVRRPSERL